MKNILSPKNWVVSSLALTPCSVQISILALLETVVATTFAIWLASMSYYWVIWTSAFLTPFVHLRSRKSMDLGQKWLNHYWSGSSQELWVPNLLAGALSTSLMWLFLLHLSGWFAEVSTQYHSTVFELLFGVVPTALALLSYCFVVSPAAVLSKSAAILSVLNTLAYVSISTCYDGCFSHVGLVPTVAITVSIILLLANFGSEVVSKVLTKVAILLIIPFLVLGVSLRVLAIRIVATLMTINHGKSNFVSNWNELITRTDILTKPEIVPGLEATCPSSGFLAPRAA